MTKLIGKSLTQFVLNILRPYKNYIFLIAVIGFLWAISLALLPYTLKIIIDKATAHDLNRAALFPMIQPYIIAYVLIWAALCIALRALDCLKLHLFPSLKQDIFYSMFAYVIRNSYTFFQNNFSGSLINKISNMNDGIINAFTILEEVYGQCLGIVIAVITLIIIHPLFAWILVTWVITFSLITAFFMSRIKKFAHAFSESQSSLIGNMIDSISNIIAVKLFSNHQLEARLIQHSIEDVVKENKNMLVSIVKMRLLWDLSTIALLAFDLIFLAKLYSQHKVTIGDFSFIMGLSLNILWNLSFIAGQLVSFSEELGKCTQALSIVNSPPNIVHHPDATELVVSKGEIEFKEVHFHYPGSEKLYIEPLAKFTKAHDLMRC
jgi:ATP-binding cassette subfamily B protein